MQAGLLPYNPNFTAHTPSTSLIDFVWHQDAVPALFTYHAGDTLVPGAQIIRTRLEKPANYSSSVFTKHELKPLRSIGDISSYGVHGWISAVFLICFAVIAIARKNYSKRFQQVFKAFFANRFFSQFSREGGIFNELMAVMLFVNFLLGLSIFIYRIYMTYSGVIEQGWHSFLIFAVIFIGTSLFFLLKMLMVSVSGFIFNCKREALDYRINIFIFGQITGIVILPLVLLAAFMPYKFIVVTGIVIISLLFIYSLFRAMSYTIYSTKISAYYLFLYLCTLEFLPLVMLSKIFIV